MLRSISLISNFYSIFNQQTSQFNQQTSQHPTSIPWIDNSISCENSGRVWENDKCWDSEHSAMF
ncbi:MAG: hypothetical protein EAZ77_04260 [Nostocales cyanobacterium]|nr:MAG: hypothetical protein EAZ77_04260 [Nostocales cyanobacterium]